MAELNIAEHSLDDHNPILTRRPGPDLHNNRGHPSDVVPGLIQPSGALPGSHA